jgi:hypothetical protein
MFVSQPVNGLIYVARRRERGGKLLIWTAVPVARSRRFRPAEIAEVTGLSLRTVRTIVGGPRGAHGSHASHGLRHR